MAKAKRKAQQAKPKFDRPVDRYFYNMDEQLTGSIPMYAFGVFLSFFALMGLIWMIPFPQLGFLERMQAQTFLNWGSFFIAIVVYAYLKLAPTLSYVMLFTIGVMSFLIVQLEYVERDHGLPAWIVFAVLALIALTITLFAYRKDAANNGAKISFWQVLTIGPLWLWSLVFRKLGWRY